MNEKTLERSDTLTVYEVSYLLLPSLALEQVPNKADSIKDMLTSLGGQVVSLENPILIDLAYPMTKVVQTVRHKVNTGYFGWIKFEIEKGQMEAVKKALDADDDVVRYLIIKTVSENTLLHGKMKLQKEEKVKKEVLDVDEEVVASDDSVKESLAEDIDKSIDDLVIA